MIIIVGCTWYVHALDLSRDKLDPRAIKCVFLGYSLSRTQKGYTCYSPILHCQFVFADVTFNEYFPYLIAPQPSPTPNYYLPTLVPVVPLQQDKPLQVCVCRKRSATVPPAQSSVVQSSSLTRDPSFPPISIIAPFDPIHFLLPFARCLPLILLFSLCCMMIYLLHFVLLLVLFLLLLFPSLF